MRHALAQHGSVTDPNYALAELAGQPVVASGSPTVDRAPSMLGIIQGYVHQAVEQPLPTIPTFVRSSAFQPTLVQHSGYSSRSNPHPVFMPRNFGLSFKVARQIDASANPAADAPQVTPRPQWRRALSFPRAVATPQTYPITSRG